MKNLITLLLAVSRIIIGVSCTKSIVKSGITDESKIIAIAPADSLVHYMDSIKHSKTLSSRRHIYLTIDDAPLNGSMYIDSVISDAKVKTNIFVVGNPIHGSGKFKKYHETLKENKYIELYNHSYSHANHRYANYYKEPELVVSDFDKNMTEFNLHHYIARLPGRNLWHLGERKKNYRQTGAEAAGLLAKKGYKIFGWDIEWKYDAKGYLPQQTVEELIEEIENASGTFTSNHIVILMHDQMFAKINEKNNLAELIEKLLERDFTFEYLSNYPDVSDN